MLDHNRDNDNDHDHDTVTMFRAKIDKKTVKNDYELQALLRIINIHSIDIEDLILEPRYEEAIRNIPGASDILKIKMRLLYIIIALNIYRDLFEEKKKYHSDKTSQYIGVFQYNEYILRIDDSPYSFINENEVIAALRETPGDIIIRPFLVYINTKRNLKNEICDCREKMCGCSYYDNANIHPGMGELSTQALLLYNKLRSNTISFSIQHYVKNTVTLYNWVRDNIGNTVYKQFSTIQHPFYVTLFERCARLLEDIHASAVVHGDIKPDNILIREHDNFDINHPEKCKNFTVYLIDFGLSGIRDVGVGTGGTIPYCHPEFKNIRDTNKTSKYHWKTLQLKHDVWSLGVMFITMYIYHDFYNYYYKYPDYFFTADRYVSSLIIGVIAHKKLNELFTEILSVDCIPISEVCLLLKDMTA
jgi:serine/threonine protein kinase